jgi:hypothetical protein
MGRCLCIPIVRFTYSYTTCACACADLWMDNPSSCLGANTEIYIRISIASIRYFLIPFSSPLA